ncbi:ABC transporter permease [Agrococcus sp. SGAir0287]|uniref:ABC transporter permease n=1 Tax=Agrococcus sp. SGAir0287 TaxID=2070347 RepID=UPI0010CD4DB0|nr:ABC transporter permease [Agrococcus sp. SGAir0287]QCR18604.1 ABC transporter [Agrococcus sp. SGAir0287]
MSADTTQQADAVAVGIAAARRTRRLGWWFVAEQRIRAMRAYVGTWIGLGLASPFLYVAGLGFGLAIVVNDAQGGQDVGGADFLLFLAPALVLGSAMQTAAQESTYGIFGGFKWVPIFMAMRSSPVSPAQMVVGYTIGTLVRVIPLSIVYVAAIWLLGVTESPRVLWLVPIAWILVLAVALPVTAWAAHQEQDRGQLNFIDRFVTLPLMLFSGTYFPLETLPIFLQWIGWISPLWHAVDLGRWAVYGAPVPGWLVVVHVAVLVGFAVVGFLLAVRVFVRRLDL